jgi:hypothetical protein
LTALVAITFTFLGYRLSMQSVRISQRALETSQLSLQVGQRAYLTVREGHVDVAASGTGQQGMVLALAVEFENLGNTPAAVNEWSMTYLVPRDAPGGLLLPSKVTSLARLPGLDSVARGPSKRLLRLPAVGQIGQRSRKRLQVLDLIGPVDLEDRWKGRERELENFWAHAKAFFWSKVYLSFSGELQRRVRTGAHHPMVLGL